ncbi:MAG TPA: hypothetical protein VMS74_14400 [Acidimicrobiia bacterium]|nr:hypothetical protein [Acidimicrobiia bacterium]
MRSTSRWRSAPINLATWSAQDYPMPIVDHAAVRERTLAAYSRAMR